MKHPGVVKMSWYLCDLFVHKYFGCYNINMSQRPLLSKKSDMWYCLVKSQQKDCLFSNLIACNTESILIILAGK